jgi:hypothetical protein
MIILRSVYRDVLSKGAKLHEKLIISMKNLNLPPSKLPVKSSSCDNKTCRQEQQKPFSSPKHIEKTMVRLSKPGTQLQPVSYLHTIDDEEVLKALEKLRRRAIGVDANSQPITSTPVSTPRKSKNGTIIPVTPSTSSTTKSTSRDRSSPKTPTSDDGSQRASTTTASTMVPRPASPRPIRDTVTASTATDEFIPLWKLNPKVEHPSVPRWQIETAVQERAAQELTVASETDEGMIMDSPRISSREKPRPEVDEIKYKPNGKEDHRGFVKNVMNEVPSPPRIRRPTKIKTTSTEKTPCLSIDRFSTILNKFGCFGVVDRICEPTTDFSEDFTLFSGTSVTYAELLISKSEDLANHDETDGKDVGSSNTPTSQSRNGERARRGLGDLGPMVTMLESFKSFLALGNSKASHLRYISGLLHRMEDKLQEYRGYRRKSNPDQREHEANLNSVSQQIDEVNKLILRVIEDFVDEQVMKVTEVDSSSLLSTSMYDVDDSLILGELDNDWTTIGDETGTLYDEPPDESDSVVIPPAVSFDRDYRPPTVGGSLAPNESTSRPREEATTGRDGSGPLSSPALASSHIQVLSAETCSEDQKLIPRLLSTDEKDDHKSFGNGSQSPSRASKGSNRDDKSLISSKSNTSRTTLIQNLSKVMSRSPKTRNKKQHASPSPNRNSVQGITDLDGTLFVPAQQESKEGLPPLRPRPRRGREQVPVDINDIDTCGEATPQTSTRSFSAGRKMFERRGSASSDTNGSLRSVVSGTKDVVQSPVSVTCVVDPMDDDSV